MSPIQNFPSFKLALHRDHYKTVLPNILYPSRPSTDIPWSGSSAPLVFSKTTRPEITVATPSVQVLTPNACLVPGAVYGVATFIWYNLSKIFQKLKLITQKLFGV